MKKSIWKSKTLWGFGFAALVWFANAVLGVGFTDDNWNQVLQIVGALWGVYGLRTALN